MKTGKLAWEQPSDLSIDEILGATGTKTRQPQGRRPTRPGWGSTSSRTAGRRSSSRTASSTPSAPTTSSSTPSRTCAVPPPAVTHGRSGMMPRRRRLQLGAGDHRGHRPQPALRLRPQQGPQGRLGHRRHREGRAGRHLLPRPAAAAQRPALRPDREAAGAAPRHPRPGHGQDPRHPGARRRPRTPSSPRSRSAAPRRAT